LFKKEIQLEIAHVLFIDIVGYLLDPIWDPLRADPAFQKTLRGKAAVNPARFLIELLIPTGEQSGLLTRIATESVSLCERMNY